MKPLLTLASLLLLVSPAVAQEKPKVLPVVIGHRGSCADRPENTLASFRRAIEAGAAIIECDPRRTRDGQLVLMHDATVDRTTDGKGKVSELTLEEVKKLDAGEWFDAKYKVERVPTLAETLAVCKGKVDVLIDLKEDTKEYNEAVLAAVKEHGEPKRTLFGVRSVEQAKYFRRMPEARRVGLIPEAEDFDIFVGVGVTTIRVWAKWVAADPMLVERVRWAGAKVLINPASPKDDDVLAVLKYRPDFLSSDDPAALIKLLREAPAVALQPPRKPKIPVIIDTDLGSDIDDAFALGLALASPELDVKAVTTVGKQAEDRAWMVRRFLTQAGRRIIPVAAGGTPEKTSDIDWQIQYRRHAALIFDRMGRPEKTPAVELMYSLLKENPKEITLVCLGPLTNVAALLDKHPDCKPWIKRIVAMGGSIRVNYKGKRPPEPEWNIQSDIPAARKVFASGVPLTLVPLDATATVTLDRDQRDKIFRACTPLTYQMQSLYELWDKETPVLFDPVAVAAVVLSGSPGAGKTGTGSPSTEEFLKFDELYLEIDDKGMTLPSMDRTTPLISIATSIDREAFTKWFVGRLSVGKAVLPKPAKNPAKLIERGGFPAKVHVAENYDTDIEKRWWMSGKAETKDVPPGGVRSQRAVLTQDFDDLQGDVRTMYRGVVFNPVPGPPMGPNTRLAFRYKLTGTDTVRIQLYSLSNGYHRYLSVSGLEQGKWLDGCVDMTQMRRPDGTGGPLAADERIDDIQFYIDPRAELLIDDIVLYDAAPVGEKRSFPSRIVFTGWFDTGKQGAEWPGDFTIVPHEKPRTWKYAKSVADGKMKENWLRVGLRGERRIDGNTEVTFRYRLTGADSVKVILRNSKTGWSTTQTLSEPKTGEWAEATLAFNIPGVAGKPLAIDEVQFRVGEKGELGVDDLLIYTPGK